jgi:hypothetical protein
MKAGKRWEMKRDFESDSYESLRGNDSSRFVNEKRKAKEG